MSRLGLVGAGCSNPFVELNPERRICSGFDLMCDLELVDWGWELLARALALLLLEETVPHGFSSCRPLCLQFNSQLKLLGTEPLFLGNRG